LLLEINFYSWYSFKVSTASSTDAAADLFWVFMCDAEVKGGGGGKRKSQRASTSQQFVLPEVHPLDDVPTVVKHPPNVLCVYGTRKMWIAVVLAVATCCADALKTQNIRQFNVHKFFFKTTGKWILRGFCEFYNPAALLKLFMV